MSSVEWLISKAIRTAVHGKKLKEVEKNTK
jgi:hypothetical protein